MPRKAKQASIPIEFVDSKEISESQKKHYSKLGYKPYLSHGGKIKWLSFEQHAYEMIKYNNKKKLFSIKNIHVHGTKAARFYRDMLKSIIRNWLLIIILLGIAVLLLNLKPIMLVISNLNM